MEENEKIEQSENTTKTDKPWLWKKGFCPNPGGRPKGKSMKDYAREYLSKMTDEERDEWLDGLPKEVIWKMSEGNPKNDVDVQSGGEKIDFYDRKQIVNTAGEIVREDKDAGGGSEE